MKSYTELKKNIKKYKNMQFGITFETAILGDVATQFLAAAVEADGYEHGIRLNVYDADYDTIETEVLDQFSGLFSCRRDFVIFAMSSEKAYEAFCALPPEKRSSFAEGYAGMIREYHEAVYSKTDTKIIQLGFNRIDEGVFGNFGMKERSSFTYQLQKLNLLLADEASENGRLFLIDTDSIQSSLGRKIFCDERFFYSARMSMSFDALVPVAENICSVILACSGRINKCLVLDLDNTLWGGVIGDDGLDGIELGELGNGRVFSDIQRWCLELKNRGVILTVCSKNDEETAKLPFLKHPDMLLKLEDFAVFIANWEDKAANIRTIQQTLNIGMDSMVFIDDSQFERNMVREMIPEINVPELPEAPEEYLSFLKELDLFETVSYSDEDRKRTDRYRQEAGRRSLAVKYASADEYLKGLEMKAEARPFEPFFYPRIAELSQRSNQFNLRTVRYTDGDIRGMAESDKYITRYFTLSDRFGDYGLISAVILEKRDDSTAFIDTWFMSCRVLKRSMEEFIINSVMSAAAGEGIRYVVGEYIKTPKNGMVADIYLKMGFEQTGNGIFRADTKKFSMLSTFVEEKDIEK